MAPKKDLVDGNSDIKMKQEPHCFSAESDDSKSKLKAQNVKQEPKESSSVINPPLPKTKKSPVKTKDLYPYKCRLCTKAFSKIDDAQVHYQDVHEKEKPVEKIVKKLPKTEDFVRNNDNSATPMVSCRVCRNVFYKVAEFIYHFSITPGHKKKHPKRNSPLFLAKGNQQKQDQKTTQERSQVAQESIHTELDIKTEIENPSDHELRVNKTSQERTQEVQSESVHTEITIKTEIEEPSDDDEIRVIGCVSKSNPEVNFFFILKKLALFKILVFFVVTIK